MVSCENENLTNEELLILAKSRITDGYENMSRQQLEITFKTPPAPKYFLDLLQDLRPSPKIPTPFPRIKNFTPKKPTPSSKPQKHTFDVYKPKNIAKLFNEDYIKYKTKDAEEMSIDQRLDLVTFTRKIFNGKRHFCTVSVSKGKQQICQRLSPKYRIIITHVLGYQNLI